MQSVINLPEQLVGGQLRRKVPQLPQLRQEILYRLLRAGTAGVIEISFTAAANSGQQIRRKAQQR